MADAMLLYRKTLIFQAFRAFILPSQSRRLCGVSCVYGGGEVCVAGLKKQEEAYVQRRFEGLSQRKAYRAAFPQSKRWTDATVDNKACELEKRSEIRVRLAEIKNENAEDARMSRQSVLKKIEDIINSKGVTFKGSDIINALRLYVEMCGLGEQSSAASTAQTAELLTTISKSLAGSPHFYDPEKDTGKEPTEAGDGE